MYASKVFKLPLKIHSLDRTKGSLQSSTTGRAICKLPGYGQQVHKSMRQRKLQSIQSNPLNNTFGPKGSRTRNLSCKATASAVAHPPNSSTPVGKGFFDAVVCALRAFVFYTNMFALSIISLVVMMVTHPFIMMFDKYKRTLHNIVSDVWARLSTLPFCKVKVEGKEKLLPYDEPCVYVVNHQSFLDIGMVFRIHRRFKFISKSSMFAIPFFGWTMFLVGHVGLKRLDMRSRLDCLKRCQALLKKGCSILLFPEGTRSENGELQQFQKGAFSVAAKADVPVQPITLVGTGQLMQKGKEGFLREGYVDIIVHDPIYGNNAGELCQQAQDVIAQELSKHEYLVKHDS